MLSIVQCILLSCDILIVLLKIEIVIYCPCNHSCSKISQSSEWKKTEAHSEHFLSHFLQRTYGNIYMKLVNIACNTHKRHSNKQNN